MKSLFNRFVLLTLVLTLLVGCSAPASSPTAAGTSQPSQADSNTAAPTTPAAETPAAQSGSAVTLNVMTHDSFAATEAVIRKFEQENNIKLNFIKSGDAGAALNRAILSKGAPQADVFYGI